MVARHAILWEIGGRGYDMGDFIKFDATIRLQFRDCASIFFQRALKL